MFWTCFYGNYRSKEIPEWDWICWFLLLKMMTCTSMHRSFERRSLRWTENWGIGRKRKEKAVFLGCCAQQFPRNVRWVVAPLARRPQSEEPVLNKKHFRVKYVAVHCSLLLVTGFSVKLPPKSWWNGLVGVSFFGWLKYKIHFFLLNIPKVIYFKLFFFNISTNNCSNLVNVKNDERIKIDT